MSDPFTLRVFVPSGDPEGSRIVEKMNWTGRGYHVPHDDWPNIRDRPGVHGAIKAVDALLFFLKVLSTSEMKKRKAAAV
jgi:hypothetical protein